MLLILLALLPRFSTAIPLQTPLTPSVPQDFPDPSLLKLENSWYSFATSSKGINVQVARSFDFKSWQVWRKDALPKLPSWVDARLPEIWAPDVIRNDHGEYVMYFSANLAGSAKKHCIGAARSPSVIGPYTALERPLICPDPSGIGQSSNAVISSIGRGGAIDASGFRDRNGARYVVYKVDGNSLSPGGPCGNGGPRKTPTPLMLVRVASDGISPLSVPIPLLDRAEIDGPLIEAPSLGRLRDGSYALLFSSNCWNTDKYDVAWAKATSITGPYVRQSAMLNTGRFGLVAPGGASITDEGRYMVFHAKHPMGRAMFSLAIDGSIPSLHLA